MHDTKVNLHVSPVDKQNDLLDERNDSVFISESSANPNGTRGRDPDILQTSIFSQEFCMLGSVVKYDTNQENEIIY